MIRAALFDLDGVLLDTEGIYTKFWQDIDCEFPTGYEDFAIRIKGNTLTNILNVYFPDDSVKEEIMRRLHRQEDEMQYCLFDGAIDLMASLKREGIATAIVTSSNAAKMRHVMGVLPELAGLIDALVVDEDVTASKPDPQGYLKAAARLGVEAPDFVVFEDSLAGLEAGRRAGGKVIGVATTNPRSVVEPLCDCVVDTIAGVLPICGGSITSLFD